MPNGQVAYGEGSPGFMKAKTSDGQRYEPSQGTKIETSFSGLRQSSGNISSKFKNDAKGLDIQTI